MSHTLTVEVPDDVYQALAEDAEKAGRPPEALAAELLTEAAQRLSHDPLEKFIGAFDSRGSDWAEGHDAHLAAAPHADRIGTS